LADDDVYQEWGIRVQSIMNIKLLITTS